MVRRGAARKRTCTAGTSPRGLPGGQPHGRSSTKPIPLPRPGSPTKPPRCSKARQVAAGIRRRATRDGLDPRRRINADKAAGYLTNKANHLDYPKALAQGWPIATGIIEGACRHLVKDRMELTGARWGLHGAEAILKLRALRSNGDFDDYWNFHLACEHQRVHRSRYADNLIPEAA